MSISEWIEQGYMSVMSLRSKVMIDTPSQIALNLKTE